MTQTFVYQPPLLAHAAPKKFTGPIFWHFVALFCTTICFMSLWPSDALETGLNASRMIELGLLCTGAAIIGYFAQARQAWRVRIDRPGLAIIALFCTWAFLSAVWSPARVLTIGKSLELVVLTFSMVMAGCWAAVYLPSPRTLPTISAVALTCIIFLLLVYNIPIHGTPFAVPEGVRRARLILGFSHPLEGADLIALALISLLACGMRVGFKGLLFLLVGGVFALTQPRGALGGFVAGIMAMMLVRIRRPDVRIIVFGGIVLLFAGVLMFIGPDLPKIMDLLIPDDAPSLNGRTELWEYAATLIREKPILGWGYYASRFMLLDLFSWAGHTHNAYLEVALSLGLPGLLLTIAFMVHVLKVAMRTKDAWLAGLAGYSFTVAFLDPLVMTPGIPMGLLILAVIHAERREAAGALPKPAAYRGYDPRMMEPEMVSIHAR